jgi:hypothetical protein
MTRLKSALTNVHAEDINISVRPQVHKRSVPNRLFYFKFFADSSVVMRFFISGFLCKQPSGIDKCSIVKQIFHGLLVGDRDHLKRGWIGGKHVFVGKNAKILSVFVVCKSEPNRA